MTLQEAQIAKIDLALGKLGLQARHDACSTVGLRLGAPPMRRAIEQYDVNVVGLTLSKKPGHPRTEVVRRDGQPPAASGVVLDGWEEVQRAPSTASCRSGAFRALRPRTATTTSSSLAYVHPATLTGVMLLHTNHRV